MSSIKQIEANRRNARKSTGPKTNSGKQRVAMNALKHGLRAENIVIPGEDAEEFEALKECLQVEWQPEGTLEELLVDRMALCIWRLRRLATMEGVTVRGHHLEVCAGAVDDAFITDEKLSKDEKSKPILAMYQTLNEDRLLSHAFGAARQVLETLLRYEVAMERSLRSARLDLENLQTARRAKAKKPANVIDVDMEGDQSAKAKGSPGKSRPRFERTR